MAFIFLTLMNHTRMVLEAACSTRWRWSSVWFSTYRGRFVSQRTFLSVLVNTVCFCYYNPKKLKHISFQFSSTKCQICYAEGCYFSPWTQNICYICEYLCMFSFSEVTALPPKPEPCLFSRLNVQYNFQ